MLTSTQPPALRRPWWQRLLRGVGIYFVVAFLTSFIGLNLLGAVIFSGPLIGRVVDADGKGIPGAFVSYEWKGQALHGLTSCQAAAIVRSGNDGSYFVPWQGWRLFHALGWGISPAGPAVWAPGYVAISDNRAGYKLVPESKVQPTDQPVGSGFVDKGACFGWAYHKEWVELRATRFTLHYNHVCASPRTGRVADMDSLVGDYLGFLLALDGSSLAKEPELATKVKPLRSLLQDAAYPKEPTAEDAMATPEQSGAFCDAIRMEYLASGGKFHEQ